MIWRTQKNRNSSFSSSGKDRGKLDGTLNMTLKVELRLSLKLSNSTSSTSYNCCHYKADDDFCFIGSNNLDKNFGYANHRLKDVKLQREPNKN